MAWSALARLPVPVLIGDGLVPLAMPPTPAIGGWGTVGRWAALAGFCLVGSALTGLVGLGIVLELVAAGAPGVGVRLEVLVGRALLAVAGD